MSASDWNELYSAYLDGEVTGEERALVEQRLEQFPAAREALDELSEVSDLVRGLPRPVAPAGLAGDVLDHLRSIEAPIAVAAAAPPAPSFAEYLRHRRWRVAGLVTAACVAVGLFLSRKPIGPLEENMIALEQPPAGALPGEVSRFSPDPAADSMMVMSAPADSEGGVPGSASAGTPGMDRESLSELVQMRGRNLKRGEVVRMLQSNLTDTRVLVLTVVDSYEFAGTARTLFAKNGIEPIEVEAPSGSEGENRSQSPAGDNVYVYFVEGDEQRLDQSLEELDQSPSLISSGDYGTLDEVARESLQQDQEAAAKPEDQFGVASMSRSSGATGLADQPPSALENQPAPPGPAEDPSAKSGPPEPAAPPLDEEGANVDAMQLAAPAGPTGYQVAVPRETAEGLVQQVQSRLPKSAPGSRVASRGGDQRRFRAMAETSNESRPSRVLIILQDAPRPAAAEKP